MFGSPGPCYRRRRWRCGRNWRRPPGGVRRHPARIGHLSSIFPQRVKQQNHHSTLWGNSTIPLTGWLLLRTCLLLVGRNQCNSTFQCKLSRQCITSFAGRDDVFSMNLIAYIVDMCANFRARRASRNTTLVRPSLTTTVNPMLLPRAASAYTLWCTTFVFPAFNR